MKYNVPDLIIMNYVCMIADKRTKITFAVWAQLLHRSFERYFWISSVPRKQFEPRPELINRRTIYKDSYGASQPWADFQLRCNYPIAMVVVSLIMLFSFIWAEFDSLWPSDATWHLTSWSPLVQVMTWLLTRAKPLPEPMLSWCQSDPMKHISMKFYLKIENFSSRKMDLKLSSAKCGPFCTDLDVLISIVVANVLATFAAI